MFSLHPQLDADTITVGDLSLSRVLLMNHSELPWLILVPRIENVSEWFELPATDQKQLHLESMLVFKGDKLNTGALGNLVPQLHIHHIVRFKNDSVWPKPVWGNIKSSPYVETEIHNVVTRVKQGIRKEGVEFSLY